MSFGAKWGQAEWGLDRWGFPNLVTGTVLEGAATITAEGTLAALGYVFIFNSSTITGLGTLTATGGFVLPAGATITALGTLIGAGGILLSSGATFTALGILYNRVPGTRDSTLLAVLWPRANPTFMIPLAYITRLHQLNSPVQNQSTEPTAIVEILGSPEYNE